MDELRLQGPLGGELCARFHGADNLIEFEIDNSHYGTITGAYSTAYLTPPDRRRLIEFLQAYDHGVGPLGHSFVGFNPKCAALVPRPNDPTVWVDCGQDPEAHRG